MILRTLWLRPTLARPGRFLATVLGVAIGVAAVVSTLLASRAAVASLDADVDVLDGSAALEIRRPGGVEAGDLGALRELCGDALLAPVAEDVVHLPGIGDHARILGIDLLAAGEERPLELAAEVEDPADVLDRLLLGRGVALPERLAAELGVAVGDALEAVVRSRRVELEVVALLRPERLASASERLILADVGLVQELYGRAGRYDRVEVRPRRELDVEALAAALEGRLPAGYRVAPASERRLESEGMVRALEFNLTALSGVSLLVGLVLVATTLATSVVQRRSAIALLRSLGASPLQLARAVLVEAAAIGLLGGALGVLLGWLGARGALASVRATVATVNPEVLQGTVVLEPRWVLLGLAAGLSASLVAALLPLREALQVPPVQGLRTERPGRVGRRAWLGRLVALTGLGLAAWVTASLPPWGDRPIWALASSLLVLASLLVLSGPLVELCASLRLRGGLGAGATLPLRLAQASLGASRRRASWAAGAVGVAVGLAVAMATMVGSFRRTVVDWTETTMRSDLFVRPLAAGEGVASGRVDPEVVRIARELFGTDAVDPFHSAAAYVDGRRIELAGAHLGVADREGGVPFLDGRPVSEVFAETLARGGAVVNEPFARRFGAGAGDWIELETPAGTVEREVVGVYRDYSGHNGRVVLDRADFLGLYPDEGAQSLAIFLGGESPVSARSLLAGALDGRFALEVLLGPEVRAEVLAVFERTFAITVALQLVAAVVAGMAVITVLGALVRERRRELAVMRALGASARQLIGVVVGEALLLGLAGAAGGLLIGVLVGYVLVAVVNVQSFGWTLRFLPPWGSVAGTAGLVIPACLLAGLVPAFLTLRRAPQEDLRELA